MKFIKTIKIVIKEALFLIGLFVENNIRNLASLLVIILPYLMFFIGRNMPAVYNNYNLMLIVLVPILFWLIIYLLKAYSNKIGKGTDVPVPIERFTSEDDGEVTVETSRTQEMILYMADLENWLERKGLL